MSDWHLHLTRQAKGQMAQLTLLDSKTFESDSLLGVNAEANSNTNTLS